MDAFTKYKPALSKVQHEGMNAAGMIHLPDGLNRCGWCDCSIVWGDTPIYCVSFLGDIYYVCHDCLLRECWHIVYLTPVFCREFVDGYAETTDFDSF